ncbi:poly(A) binding protein Crp79 [Rhodotorula toruloides]|uniref:Poly(A) binding protein Crp79 n=1 Tax=Rhodotorula toruloides TaxID=5286 RepID=A0A511KBA6_RHOTO|nr:poly(A) binding protein Crp79 [Rhodotorula toruloides]
MATAAAPPPHPVLSTPILCLSGLPSSVADEEIVEVLKDCLRLRLFLQRDEKDPSAPLSGKIEFETLDKAERAYATCNNQRLASGNTLVLSFTPPSSASPDPEPHATPRVIKQLPRTFSASELYALCRLFGPIHSATLLLSPSPAGPRFKGQALVTFYDEAHAREMQNGLHFAEVGGQNVAVQVWDAKRAGASKGPASLGAPMATPGEKVSRWAAATLQQQDLTPSKHSPYAGLGVSGAAPSAREVEQSGGGREAGTDPRNLFIKNLPSIFSTSSLSALFSPYGALTSTSVALDPHTGVSKGFGFVAFERREDAQKALREVDGMEVSGRRVTVRVHERREARRERLERQFGARMEEVQKGMEGLSTGPTTPSSSPPRTSNPLPPLSLSDAPTTPPQPHADAESEHDRLVAAVGEVLGADVGKGKREEVVRLIEGLPRKDRRMCLFNSKVLRLKVGDALAILEEADGEERENEEMEAAKAPILKNDSTPVPASLPALAALPCSQILPLLPSLALSLPTLSAADLAPTHAFMDSLDGKAPRITIELLDSEPDLRALAVVVLHYKPVLEEKVVIVAKRLAGEEGKEDGR